MLASKMGRDFTYKKRNRRGLSPIALQNLPREVFDYVSEALGVWRLGRTERTVQQDDVLHATMTDLSVSKPQDG